MLFRIEVGFTSLQSVTWLGILRLRDRAKAGYWNFTSHNVCIIRPCNLLIGTIKCRDTENQGVIMNWKYRFPGIWCECCLYRYKKMKNKTYRLLILLFCGEQIALIWFCGFHSLLNCADEMKAIALWSQICIRYCPAGKARSLDFIFA